MQWTDDERYVNQSCEYKIDGRTYVLNVETPALGELELTPGNEGRIERALPAISKALIAFERGLKGHANIGDSGNTAAKSRLARQRQQLQVLLDQEKEYHRWLIEQRLDREKVEFQKVLELIRTAPEEARTGELYERLRKVVTQSQDPLCYDEVRGRHLRALHALISTVLARDSELRKEVHRLRPVLHNRYTWGALARFGTSSQIVSAVLDTWGVHVDTPLTGENNGDTTLLMRLARSGPAEHVAWALGRGADPNFCDNRGYSVLVVALDHDEDFEHCGRLITTIVSSPRIAQRTVGHGLKWLLRSWSAARRSFRYTLLRAMLVSDNACKHLLGYDRDSATGGLLQEVYAGVPSGLQVLDPSELYLIFHFLHDHHNTGRHYELLRMPSGQVRQRLRLDLQTARAMRATVRHRCPEAGREASKRQRTSVQPASQAAELFLKVVEIPELLELIILLADPNARWALCVLGCTNKRVQAAVRNLQSIYDLLQAREEPSALGRSSWKAILPKIAFESASSLRGLWLREVGVRRDCASILAHLQGVQKLTIFDAAGASSQQLSNLRNAKSLQELRCAPDDLAVIRRLAGFGQELRSLHLASRSVFQPNPIDVLIDPELKVSAPVEPMIVWAPRLEELTLDFSDTPQLVPSLLTKLLAGCNHLRKLSLLGFQLWGGALAFPGTLTSLVLKSRSPLTDSGFLDNLARHAPSPLLHFFGYPGVCWQRRQSAAQAAVTFAASSRSLAVSGLLFSRASCRAVCCTLCARAKQARPQQRHG
eukprot:g1986.t1